MPATSGLFLLSFSVRLVKTKIPTHLYIRMREGMGNKRDRKSDF